MKVHKAKDQVTLSWISKGKEYFAYEIKLKYSFDKYAKISSLPRWFIQILVSLNLVCNWIKPRRGEVKGVPNLRVKLGLTRRLTGGSNLPGVGRPAYSCGLTLRFKCEANRLGPRVLMQPALDRSGTGTGRLAWGRPPGSGLLHFVLVFIQRLVGMLFSLFSIHLTEDQNRGVVGTEVCTNH
jgi:hypothetical protein